MACQGYCDGDVLTKLFRRLMFDGVRQTGPPLPVTTVTTPNGIPK